MKIENFFNNFEKNFDEFLKKYTVDNEIEIYNEFNLQHEFGIYLKDKFMEYEDYKDYKVEFERNVSFFGITYDKEDINYYELEKEGYTDEKKLFEQLKHEIDIVIYNKDKTKKYAVEVKYPSIKSYYDEEKQKEIKKANGAYPKAMYSFIKDIKFMEVLSKEFTKTYSVTLVNVKDANANKKFYESSFDKRESDNEIYKYFRMGKNNQKIKGLIPMPTGKNKEGKAVYINGEYVIKWNSWSNKEEIGKYYIVSIEKEV